MVLVFYGDIVCELCVDDLFVWLCDMGLMFGWMCVFDVLVL